MISLAQAQEKIFALSQSLQIEESALNQSAGRYLAQDVIALRTQPACNMSAMDGYALAYAKDQTQWELVGEAPAGGEYSGIVNTNEAVRIFTGAPLPEGTDTIIIQEDTAVSNGNISTPNELAITKGQHVRLAGSDFSKGQTLIEKDTLLNPAHIGLAAMAGHATMPLYKRPRIAIISNGDELVEIGAQIGPNQIPNSNGVMMEAMLRNLPCDITANIILPDQQSLIEGTLRECDADIIVTIGGASVGDHDLIGPALKALDADMDFWKIAMRPGKPVMAGKLGNHIVLGLPGNPVSAYVTAFLLLLPLIRHMSGASKALPPQITAELTQDLPSNGPRMTFLRAIYDNGKVTPLYSNDSAMLAILSRANCLIIRDGNAAPAICGGNVQCIKIDNI